MQFQFDAFLSHKSCDAEWTGKLKQRLEAEGLRIWLDRDELRPGDLFVQALEQGLEASRTW